MNLPDIARKNQPTVFAVAVIALIAWTYVAWQLIGLRFTTHDDIHFHLYSWIYSGDYLNYVNRTALLQARVQAYLGIPVLLWANHLADSILFDMANTGMFGIMYLSLVFFISKITIPKNAIILAAATLFLFPLHYYFTIPQGFPVVVTLVLTLAFASAGLLGSYIEQPKLSTLLFSVFLFSLSLVGSEYNFILHPAFLIVVAAANIRENFGLKRLARLSVPYAAGWIAVVLAYLSFSAVARAGGGDLGGRVSFGFDPAGLIKTFLTLTEKSFLPLSLWRGIRLYAAPAQGGPDIPGVLSFSTLWQGSHDYFSPAVVFIFAVPVFGLLLYRQRLSSKSCLYLSLVFLSLAVVPCLLLSVSAHYQLIVMKGYLQGHLATFYSQLGLSGLVFVLLSLLINRFQSVRARIGVVLLPALLLGAFAMVTFVYNNINRQAMMANKQKWSAVSQLASFIYSNRPDLRKNVLYAKEFWSASGVSAIPTDSLDLFGTDNYWAAYTKSVLEKPINMVNGDGAGVFNSVSTRYFVNPAGSPVVIISEKAGEKNTVRNTLVSAKPISGKLLFRGDGPKTMDIASSQWTCANQCSYVLDLETEDVESIRFKPEATGPKRLLAQFFMSRNSKFAQPMGW